jgi:hypothetical protein
LLARNVVPVGIEIRLSTLFPHATGASGSAAEEGAFHESTARTLTVFFSSP